MANIAEKIIDGASYTYDMESRSPLAIKNVKKMIEGTLVYGTDNNGMTAPDEIDSTAEDTTTEQKAADKVTSPKEKAAKKAAETAETAETAAE